MIVEWGSGERRVNEAVELKRWKVASSMNLGALGSRLSSSLLGGSRFGFFGTANWGVGRSTEREESADPRRGWWGMVPEWVLRVIVVLKPECVREWRCSGEGVLPDLRYTERETLCPERDPSPH